jgi:hypothetical protein
MDKKMLMCGEYQSIMIYYEGLIKMTPLQKTKIQLWDAPATN